MRYETEVQAAIARWQPGLGVRIDSGLVHAVIEQESRHGAAGLEAVEPRGHRSYGPMMVLDSTALGYGVQPKTLKEPRLGILYGVRYLGEQLKRFPGDVARAVSAYNTGPGRARRGATGKFPNQSYVDKVLGFWQRFRGLAVPALGALAAAALILALALRRRSR